MAVLEVGLGDAWTPQTSSYPGYRLLRTSVLTIRPSWATPFASIAYEKAGIIKQGVPVVSAVDKAEALSVIEKTCREKGAKLYLLGRDIWIEKAQGIDESAISQRNLCQPMQTGSQGNLKDGNTEGGKMINTGVPHAPFSILPKRGLLCTIKTWRHTYDNVILPL